MMVMARDSESPVAQQRPQKPFRSSVSCSPARPPVDEPASNGVDVRVIHDRGPASLRCMAE